LQTKVRSFERFNGVDVTKLSTDLLRRLRDEIQQQQARAAPLTQLTPGPASPDGLPPDGLDD
jgi:hypothetical protein